MKSQGLIKKDPQAAILAAEEILEKEPHSIQGNSLLRDAAAAAGMIETVGFALETMRDAEPKNTKIAHELARHYSASDQAEKAIEVYNQITSFNPADIEAVKGGKDAAARASMRTGGWDQIGKDGNVSYRDVLLANKEEAESARTAEPHRQERGRGRATAHGELRPLQREPEQPRRGPQDRRFVRAEGRF